MGLSTHAGCTPLHGISWHFLATVTHCRKKVWGPPCLLLCIMHFFHFYTSLLFPFHPFHPIAEAETKNLRPSSGHHPQPWPWPRIEPPSPRRASLEWSHDATWCRWAPQNDWRGVQSWRLHSPLETPGSV